MKMHSLGLSSDLAQACATEKFSFDRGLMRRTSRSGREEGDHSVAPDRSGGSEIRRNKEINMTGAVRGEED